MRHLSPLEINLKELPDEGRNFTYSNETKELDEALNDLIGTNAYEVSFHISPMGNTFDLKGSIKTEMDLQCSLCALDLKFPINLNLHELLVLQKPLEKGDHQGKSNHAHEWERGGPDYILLDSDVFRVADYIHEAIGLAEPIRPLGKPDCDMSCENIPEAVKKYVVTGEAKGETIHTNPFQVLEKMKLKS